MYFKVYDFVFFSVNVYKNIRETIYPKLKKKYIWEMQDEDVDNSVYTYMHETITSLKSKGEDERSNIELECRFGDQKEGHFNSSVSFTFFNTVMTMLDEYKSWDNIHDWREIMDYFYVVDTQELRSRIEILNGSPVIQTIRKKREDSRVFSVHIPYENENMFRHIFPPKNIRITVNNEDEIDDSDIPDIAEVSKTRIIHRKTYCLKHFKFEISKVWFSTGENCISDCQNKKELETPSYEIEIEMDILSDHFKNKSSNYSSISFLYKILAILNNSAKIKE